MRPDPREPSKQLNAKSLPATKRRAASGVRLSAQTGPAASNVKTTIANRVTILNPFPLRSATAALLNEFVPIATRDRPGHMPSGIQLPRSGLAKRAAAEGRSDRGSAAIAVSGLAASPRTAVLD